MIPRYSYIVVKGAFANDHIDDWPIAVFDRRIDAERCAARLRAARPYDHQYTEVRRVPRNPRGIRGL